MDEKRRLHVVFLGAVLVAVAVFSLAPVSWLDSLGQTSGFASHTPLLAPPRTIDCYATYEGKALMGFEDELGAIYQQNGVVDVRFVCVDGSFYLCGSSSTFWAAISVEDGEAVGSYWCDEGMRWVYTP